MAVLLDLLDLLGPAPVHLLVQFFVALRRAFTRLLHSGPFNYARKAQWTVSGSFNYARKAQWTDSRLLH